MLRAKERRVIEGKKNRIKADGMHQRDYALEPNI